MQDAFVFARLEQSPHATQYIIPYSEAEHARRILDPDFVYLRIVHAGALAGFFILVLDPDQDSVEFRRVVVSDQGQGIGQSAIAAMEQFCKAELRRTRIWLDVFESNSRGCHVYEKLGYRRFGESNHQRGRLLLYEKAL